MATGGRTARRQRSPRAGTFVPGPRAKLPCKRGPGGGRLRAPLGARRSRPPAILWWLSDRSESHSPPAGGEIPPKSNGAVQNRREGASPSPTRERVPYESKRATTRAPLQKTPRAQCRTTAGASPRPTWLHHMGAARPVVAPHANDHCCLSSRAPVGRVRDAAPHGRPVAGRGRWPSHPYGVLHLKLHIPIHLLEIVPHHAHLVSIKKLLTLARSGIYTKNRQLYD